MAQLTAQDTFDIYMAYYCTSLTNGKIGKLFNRHEITIWNIVSGKLHHLEHTIVAQWFKDIGNPLGIYHKPYKRNGKSILSGQQIYTIRKLYETTDLTTRQIMEHVGAEDCIPLFYPAVHKRRYKWVTDYLRDIDAFITSKRGEGKHVTFYAIDWIANNIKWHIARIR